ncbi:MAG: hypothetical protein J7513_14530 [Solirubrobacteraceae bacterium]|nr:hypothetical protein [Solirubrobacteraceae bacterium]
MTRRPILLFTLALASCGAIVGCTNDDDRLATPSSTADEPTPLAPATEVPATSTPADDAGPMQGGSTERQYAAASGTGTALLTGVREAPHDGYDRVVFEFSGESVPGYDVAYADGNVTQDGSGTTVEIAGDARLTVRMSPAADADLTDPDAPRTYTGPDRIATGNSSGVVELARIGGFEGALTWAIGVRARTDFKVSTLTDPARIVVDLRQK